MQGSFLNSWFSDQGIHAVCWTLIHSLWIGLLISAFAGLIILCTKKSSPLIRYRLLCGALFFFILLIGLTFYLEISHVYQSQNIDHHTLTMSPVVAVNASKADSSNLISQIVFFLNRQAGWILLGWLVCFMLKSIKLVTKLCYVHRLRSRRSFEIGEEWKLKVFRFSKILRIRRLVPVFQSERIKIPVTIGWLKPAILLPMGLIFQLPPDQIETILWHELAHIARRDFLVNLIQNIIETIFFFNPALLWISALIREEREACCDDIVLENVPLKSNYFEALLAFQGVPYTPRIYAMSLSARQNELLGRLKRITDEENRALSLVEKATLITGIVLFLSFFLFPKTNAVPEQSKLTLNNTTVNAPLNKTRPAHLQDYAVLRLLIQRHEEQIQKEFLARDANGNQYYLKTIGNRLTDLEVNGTTIKDRELDAYKKLPQQLILAFNNKTRQLSQTGRHFIHFKRISSDGRNTGISLKAMYLANLGMPRLAINAKNR